MAKWFDNWFSTQINRLSDSGLIKAGPSAPSFGSVSSIPGLTPDTPAVQDLSKMSAYERLAVTCSWVYSDIRVIANEVGKVKFGVHTIDGEATKPVDNHEFERMMRRPNPLMSGTFLKQYTAWWWLLRGEAYWLKVFDRAGALVQIYPIPSDRMEPLGDGRQGIRAYRYMPQLTGSPIEFLPEQIIFFRFPNPFNYIRGMSPLSAYLSAMLLDIKASLWNQTTYDKDVTLRTLIGLRPELSKPQYNKAKAEILEQLVDRQMRFMIARTGEVDVNQLSLSPRDAEYLSSRQMSRDEIDRVFGFPEGYWSMLANRANAEQAKASLIDSTIWPLVVFMAEEITAQCVVPEYGEEYVVVPEDIRIQDRRLRLAERNVHWRASTFDEARADLKLEPYDGPLNEIIGPLPYSLATNPQFVLALSEREQQQEQGEGAEGEEQPTPEETKAMRAELRTWRGIELRRHRAGKRGSYDFESYVLPNHLTAAIRVALQDTTDEEYVKSLFDAAIEFGTNGRLKEGATNGGLVHGADRESY